MPGAPLDAPTRIGPDLGWILGDIRDPAALRELCRGAEGATVFHLCGIIHPRRVRDLYAINVDGTRHVLAAAMEAGVRRVVAVSSNSPAGANPHPDHRFDEASPYRPYRHYGESKRRMEALVAEAGATGKVETVVRRPCWFYGPEQPARQTRFFSMIRDGKAPLVGRGTARRSMSYIDNTCQALPLADRSAAARRRPYWVAERRFYATSERLHRAEERRQE